MLARRRSGGGVAFIGSSTQTTTGTGATTIALPAGALPGHLAMVFQFGNVSAPSMGVGWTEPALTSLGGIAPRLSYKLLASADITAGTVALPSQSNSRAAALAVYSGAASLTLASEVQEIGGAGTSTTVPGFTKASASQGLFGLACEGYNTVSGTPNYPSPFTNRVAVTVGTMAVVRIADLLDTSLYANGSPVTVTGLSNLNVGAYIFEAFA